MLRVKIALAAALFAGCSFACAGDFLPRASGNTLAAVADDPGARSASTAAMSEPESCPTEPAAAPATPAHASAPRRAAAHVGADDVAAVERSSAAAAPALADDDKPGPPAPARKGHALRWQSLLPGVMK